MFKKYGWLPAHWGLKGKSRDIAQAEYELEGYELEKRLLEIKADEIEPRELSKKQIELEFKHKRITQIEMLRQLTELITDETQKKLALLELDVKEGKIGDIEYQKAMATIKGEPWVNVLSMEFGGKQSLEGSFELDWNDHFVANLIKEGYQGPTPDAIVNQWFLEVCRNVALEEFDGTGNFTADSAANLETMKRWNGEPIDDKRKGYK